MKSIWLVVNSFIFLFLISKLSIAQPVITIMNTDSGCVGKTFQFNSLVFSPSDPVVNYSWDFGDGSGPVSSANTSATHSYLTVGIFDVTLTVTTQNNVTASLTEPAYIRVGTVPNATIDSVTHSICFQESIQFNDLTPNPVTGWMWFFDDGGISNQQHPNHAYEYDTSGTIDPFDVVLISYYNGCADSDTVYNAIMVLPPIPHFQTTLNCNSPLTISFTNLSASADSYEWNFGDASPIENSFDPTHTYLSSGVYSVVLTATSSSNGCVVDTIQSIRVPGSIDPTIYESGQDLICNPDDSFYNYEWFFDGTLLNTCTTNTCQALQSGSYHVIITDLTTGCTDSTDIYNYIVNVDEIALENHISIFPNPLTSEVLHFEFSEILRNEIKIKFYDVLGQIVLIDKFKLDNSGLTKTIDLSTVRNGLYILSIETESSTLMKKIVINKN